MKAYECSLTLRQIEDALKPFPKEAYERMIELLLPIFDQRPGYNAYFFATIVCYGDNPMYERWQNSRYPNRRTIIAEIRHLLRQAIKQSGLVDLINLNDSALFAHDSARLVERITFLKDYLDDPSKFAGITK